MNSRTFNSVAADWLGREETAMVEGWGLELNETAMKCLVAQ